MLLSPIRPVSGGLEAELHLPASPAVVFAYVSDLHHMESWWPEHRHYRLLRGDGRAGSLYGWTYSLRGVPAAGLTRIVTHEPSERFGYRAGLPGLAIHIDYRFTPDGDGTLAAFSMRTVLAHLPGFRSISIPETAAAFERLARAVGEGATSAA